MGSVLSKVIKFSFSSQFDDRRERAMKKFFGSLGLSNANPLQVEDVEVAFEDLNFSTNDLDYIKRELKRAFKGLGGKTPKEVILEERKRLGNPSKEVKYTFSAQVV